MTRPGARAGAPPPPRPANLPEHLPRLLEARLRGSELDGILHHGRSLYSWAARGHGQQYTDAAGDCRWRYTRMGSGSNAEPLAEKEGGGASRCGTAGTAGSAGRGFGRQRAEQIGGGDNSWISACAA